MTLKFIHLCYSLLFINSLSKLRKENVCSCLWLHHLVQACILILVTFQGVTLSSTPPSKWSGWLLWFEREAWGYWTCYTHRKQQHLDSTTGALLQHTSSQWSCWHRSHQRSQSRGGGDNVIHRSEGSIHLWRPAERGQHSVSLDGFRLHWHNWRGIFHKTWCVGLVQYYSQSCHWQ